MYGVKMNRNRSKQCVRLGQFRVERNVNAEILCASCSKYLKSVCASSSLICRVAIHFNLNRFCSAMQCDAVQLPNTTDSWNNNNLFGCIFTVSPRECVVCVLCATEPYAQAHARIFKLFYLLFEHKRICIRNGWPNKLRMKCMNEYGDADSNGVRACVSEPKLHIHPLNWVGSHLIRVVFVASVLHCTVCGCNRLTTRRSTQSMHAEMLLFWCESIYEFSCSIARL